MEKRVCVFINIIFIKTETKYLLKKNVIQYVLMIIINTTLEFMLSIPY